MEKSTKAGRTECLWPPRQPAPAQYQGYSNSQTQTMHVSHGSQRPTQTGSNRPGHPRMSTTSDPPSEGRKRALLCGVSYRDKRKYRLKGTVSDVQSIKNLLLQQFHFPSSSIQVLTEDSQDLDRVPTRKNMENWLEWLVKDCRTGDSLVFFFSGHGLRQIDIYRDEVDGFDETLCPCDFLTQGMITDNYINDTIVRPLPWGVKLHAIVDACHSGTVLDLPYVYGKVGDQKDWVNNWLPSSSPKHTSGGFAVCFSACADNQKATDTNAFSPNKSIGGSPKKRKNIIGGALTTTFVKAIEQSPRISYGKLLNEMQEAIDKVNNRGGHFKFRFLKRVFHKLLLQEPQLSSSEKFDAYTRVFEL